LDRCAVLEHRAPLARAEVLEHAPAPQIASGPLQHLVLVPGLGGVVLGLQDGLCHRVGDLEHSLQVRVAQRADGALTVRAAEACAVGLDRRGEH
jgi:hypothetical protein